MLARALAELPEGAGGTLEYAAGEAEEDLWGLGFRPDRSLTWMALDPQAHGLAVASRPGARMDG
jgi:hypothetical protein